MPKILRYFQRAAHKAVFREWMEHRSCLVHIGTGGGKSVIAASIIDTVLKNGKKVLYLADSDDLCYAPLKTISEFCGVIPALEKAKHKASMIAEIVVASMQTLGKRDRLEKFPPHHFDYVFIDECFPAGTLIDKIPIESIRPGDYVSAFNEATGKIESRKVLCCFRKKPSSLLTIKAGGKTVVCTPNHPFLTTKGWVKAEDLRYTHSVLLISDDNKEMPSLSETISNIPISQREVLLHELQACQQGGCENHSEMLCLRIENRAIESRWVSAKDEAIFAKDVLSQMSKSIYVGLSKNSQSDAQSGNSGKDGGEVAWATNELQAWRKWTTDTTRSASPSYRIGLEDGASSKNTRFKRQRVSNLLQDRHSELGYTGWSRDRRSYAQPNRPEISGPKEGELLNYVRVDYIEIHQPTSDGKFNGMCVDGYVYNIEVEGLHTYSANGFVVHNCHRAAKKKKQIADYFPEAFIAGFTATPWKQGLKDLSKFYDTVAISLPMMGLVEQGFAPPIQVLTLPVEVDLNAVRQSIGGEGKDYNPDDLDTCIAPYYQKIADLIKEYAWDRKIVAFLPLIKSSEAFAAILRNNHIKAVHIDGETKDRQLVYRDLQLGNIDVICNSQVMSTGVDVPEADCFLNLRATRSPAFYQQALGRVCRPYPGCVDDLPEKDQIQERQSRIKRSPKPDTLILDLLWQHESLATVRPGDMFATSPEEARKIFDRSKDSRTPLELLELSKAVQREKELTLVEKLKEAADKHRGRDMRAEHVGVYLNDPKLMEYEPVAKWEMKRASPEQLGMLERCGVEMSTVITRGQASEIISRCIKRRKDGLATLKQVRIMHQKGVENADTIRFEDASRILDQLIGKKDVDNNKLRAEDVLMSNSKKNSFADRGFTRDEKGHIVKA